MTVQGCDDLETPECLRRRFRGERVRRVDDERENFKNSETVCGVVAGVEFERAEI